MESEHWLGKVSVRALITRDQEIFVCRGAGDNVWQLPGGRMHKNEELISSLKREIKEELGITVDVLTLLHIQTFVHIKSAVPQLVVVYLCSLTASAIMPDAKEIKEVKWIQLSEAASLPMFADCRTAIQEFSKRVR